MKHKMKIAATAVFAAAALALSGCANSDGSSPESNGDTGGESMSVALISKGFQHQFWQAVKQGAEERAAELGISVTFEGPASETEVDAQLQMLQTAIDRGPDAIGYAALDGEACIPLYDAAEAAGIPVVEFDTPCNSDYPASLAATDNAAAAALAADHMAELLGEEGKIAIVGHSQINPSAVDRRDGFANQIRDMYPNIEIVDIQYGDGDHLKSADIAKAMIAANPDLDGIYGTNEGSAIGVVNAVNELGLDKDQLVIVGFDSGAAQINAIKDGTMAGAITQDPIGIGAQVVQAAYDVVNGESVEEFYDTGSFWYDASNIDEPQIAAVLYD